MAVVSIPVTLMVAGGCAALNLWLQVRVGRMRQREKVSIGDGGSEPLIRRMRAQANFVENAPFILALVLAIELSCGTSAWLWAAGALFLVGRVLHAFGMDGVKYCRMIGTAISMGLLLALGVWALAAAYRECGSQHAIETEAVPPSA
ncbi:MAG: MAPEG family protein [Pseudomonadota bacterium]